MNFLYQESIESNLNLLLNIILDVNNYEKFVPFVRKSYIIEKSKTDSFFEADLFFDFFSYRSKINKIENDKESMVVISSDYPFKIQANWKLVPKDDNVNVSLQINAEVPYVLEKIIEKATPLVINAFIKREQELRKSAKFNF